MHRAPTHLRVLACIIACACFVLSASVAAAVAQDYRTRDVLPPGSRVEGADVGHVPLDAAHAMLERALTASLDDTTTVAAGDRTLEVVPSQFVEVDVDSALRHLSETKGRVGLARRLVAEIAEEPYGDALPAQVRVDRRALDAWVAELAAHVGQPAVDATLVVQGRQLVAVPHKPGFSIDVRRASDTVAQGLAEGKTRILLPVTRIEPSVTLDGLGTAILVRRADRQLLLYDDGRLVKTYRVAVGAPDFPTPRGQWTIIRKRYMPTWGNPGSDWAKDMPRFIPPGPNNPLGTRALDLDAPGIRIHGTNKDYSIGRAASHGCMRMHRWDIEDLFERVSVGTPVFIID